MNIFKAYDIRGKVPSELDAPKARVIGWAVAHYLKQLNKLQHGPKVVVGRDVRISSKELSDSLIQGLIEGEAKVTDIGEVTTPMCYFACGHYNFDGSVMVTASHNPAEYNGFKICREKAIALSEETGLKDIEALALKYQAPTHAGAHSIHVTRHNILHDYKKFIRGFIKPIWPSPKKPLKIVVDFANGNVGPVFAEMFKHQTSMYTISLCSEPDGRFPNHEPNPMKDENIRDITQNVKLHKADLGVAFDGDGDRVVFIDDKAERIPNDLITAMIAREMLRQHKGAGIVYDLRSSKVIKEQVEEMGGKAIRNRVGHAFIKDTMRQNNAPFGGELSGHYYFRSNFYADSALLAFVYVYNILTHERKPISEVIKPLQKYYSSGELNFTVADKKKKMLQVKREFTDGTIDELDGVTADFGTWWFNLRPSNTEPYLRLNIEAQTEKQLKAAKIKLEKTLKSR